MSFLEIAKEMKELVEANKPAQETRFFSATGLDHDTVRRGCLRILRWLTNEYTQLSKLQDRLDLSVMVDRSCIRLLEATDALQDFIIVTDGYLTFTENVSHQDIEEVFNWIEQDIPTHTFFTPRKGTELI
jgi:hypothetical protein